MVFFIRCLATAVTALGAVSVLTLAGCTSPAVKSAPERGGDEYKSWMPVADRSSLGTGQVLLAYQLNDPAHTVPKDGCRLRIENSKTHRSVFITMKSGEAGSLTSLDPGNYVTRRLGCGLTAVWTVEDLFSQGFDVQAGKVSYLGKLIFSFNSSADLEMIKKASRIEAVESLNLLLNGVAKGSGDQLISGFTDRAISPEMLSASHLEGFDVRALGLQEERVGLLTPLLSSLKVCSQDAGHRDPLRMGQLEYVAIYQAGRFQSIRDRLDNNTLTDDFRSCIEQSLHAFSFNGTKGEVRVRVRY